MEYLKLFQTENQRSEILIEGNPWDFAPTAECLAEMRQLEKERRKVEMRDKKTEWNIYTGFRGLAPNLRISNENPVAGMRALVCDYDMKTEVSAVLGYLSQINQSFLPNFIEVSLSKKIRLIWVFEQEVLFPSKEFADNFCETLANKLKVATLLAGFDDASLKPATVWTNGGEWHDLQRPPLSWKLLFGFLCDTSKKSSFGHEEIPLATIAAEVERRFPGKWEGPFEKDKTGLRFWDQDADNTTGCQIKPDGMLCFTGSVPFMKWDSIFGASWCNEKRALNLGELAGQIYFDGHKYWEFNGDRWYSIERADVLLALKTRGISGVIQRGQTVSEVEKVLAHIQKSNRIVGAAPIINQKPGIVVFDRARILNVSTTQALTPHDKPVTFSDFPWLHTFIWGLLDNTALLSVEHLLAWLQRAYKQMLLYRKMMGQAVFLCGPPENGKTLFSYQIVKPLLGGKASNPYDYFVGLTTFNSELFEAPLMAINDEEAPIREDARQKFQARMKGFVVNPSHPYSPKFLNRVSIEWTGRIFVTLNDDPGSVGLLPEINSGNRDKMMFFASRHYSGVWPDQPELEAIIAKELPFFARWLLDWQPPKEIMIAGRMGVKSFYDPRLLEISQQQFYAYNLYELIAQWCASAGYWNEPNNPAKEWVGTPTELLAEFDNDAYRSGAKEWKQSNTARGLTSIARQGGMGVHFAEGSERAFRIVRDEVLKTGAKKGANE